MAVDEARWRRHGRSVRSMESMMGGPRPMSRAEVRDAVVFALVGELMEADAAIRDAAIDAATEGYIEEHRAQGGSVEG